MNDCSRIKETKETYLNAIHDLEFSFTVEENTEIAENSEYVLMVTVQF